jgi:hypothetical protein
MSSSGRDIMDNLHNAITEFGLTNLARIMSSVNKKTSPKLDNISLRYWGILSPLVDKHTSTVTLGVTDIVDTETQGQGNPVSYFRKIPSTVRIFQSLSTLTGSPTFPLSNLKMAGKGVFNGSMYMQVSPLMGTGDLDMGTGAFGVGVWLKPTDNGTYEILCKRDASGVSSTGMEMYITGGTMVLKISDGTTVQTLTSSAINYTDGAWHSFHWNVPASGNLEVFFDGVSKGTLARTAGSITTGRNTYVFGRDNAGVADQKYNGSASWFVWKRSIWSSQNITDYRTNQLLDHSVASNDEILTFPLMFDANPYPVSTVAEFRFS